MPASSCAATAGVGAVAEMRVSTCRSGRVGTPDSSANSPGSNKAGWVPEARAVSTSRAPSRIRLATGSKMVRCCSSISHGPGENSNCPSSSTIIR
jgi:hypothetical protein